MANGTFYDKLMHFVHASHEQPAQTTEILRMSLPGLHKECSNAEDRRLTLFLETLLDLPPSALDSAMSRILTFDDAAQEEFRQRAAELRSDPDALAQLEAEAVRTDTLPERPRGATDADVPAPIERTLEGDDDQATLHRRVDALERRVDNLQQSPGRVQSTAAMFAALWPRDGQGRPRVGVTDGPLIAAAGPFGTGGLDRHGMPYPGSHDEPAEGGPDVAGDDTSDPEP